MSLPDTGRPIGRRGKIALGLCVAAGLRREEAVNVCFEDITLLPVAGKFRTVINVKGKGAKDRAVPISDDLANDIEAWAAEIGDCERFYPLLTESGTIGHKDHNHKRQK